MLTSSVGTGLLNNRGIKHPFNQLGSDYSNIYTITGQTIRIGSCTDMLGVSDLIQEPLGCGTFLFG
jgi:hypothetical protein